MFYSIVRWDRASISQYKRKSQYSGYTSLFHADIEKQLDKKINNSDIGKIITLIVKNTTDTNKK